MRTCIRGPSVETDFICICCIHSKTKDNALGEQDHKANGNATSQSTTVVEV